jgi:hypothetical protein
MSTNFLYKQMPNTKGNMSTHKHSHKGGATDMPKQGVIVDNMPKKPDCCGNVLSGAGAGKVKVEYTKPLPMRNWKGSSSFEK